jgi:hypothetical protein
MIWAASNITQGSLELYAHLYYLFTLQIFFVAIRKGDILHLPALRSNLLNGVISVRISFSFGASLLWLLKTAFDTSSMPLS